MGGSRVTIDPRVATFQEDDGFTGELHRGADDCAQIFKAYRRAGAQVCWEDTLVPITETSSARRKP